MIFWKCPKCMFTTTIIYLIIKYQHKFYLNVYVVLTPDCSHRFYFTFSHCWEKAVVIALHLSSSLFVIVCWTQPKCSDKLHREPFYKNKCAVTKPATNYCTLKIESACLIISLECLPLIESYLPQFHSVQMPSQQYILYLNKWRA